jgi:glycosyltransferase involved in cell wall biosynthesis
MKITWFATGIDPSFNNRLASSRASTRFQCLIPAKTLEKLGHKINIVQSDKILDANQLCETEFGDVNIFIKSFIKMDENLARRARVLNRKVIYSFCDFDFFKPEMIDHRKNMAELSHRCVTVSEALSKVVAHKFKIIDPIIITDPYEGPHGTPKFAPLEDKLRLVWFGHISNIQELFDQIDRLADFGKSIPVSLEVIVQPINGIEEAFAMANAKFKGHLILRLIPWSLKNTWQSLAKSDAVVIPSNNSQKKMAKSPNRVVESIRNGRFVVAHPVTSYSNFNDYIRIDTDIVKGLSWMINNQSRIKSLIEKGQAYVEQHNSPGAVANNWLKLITSVHNS